MRNIISSAFQISHDAMKCDTGTCYMEMYTAVSCAGVFMKHEYKCHKIRSSQFIFL